MNNIEELVYSAMQSSLEGYAVAVVDSIEFELSRELTTQEHQQVYVAVDSAITGIAVAQKELQDLRAQLEAAQKERGVYEAISEDVGAIITLLQGNEWAEHAAKTKVGGVLEHEITRLISSIADLRDRAEKAEAELSAASEKLNKVITDDWNEIGPTYPAHYTPVIVAMNGVTQHITYQIEEGDNGDYWQPVSNEDADGAPMTQFQHWKPLPAGFTVEGK